jgi:hypothetical protein
MKAVSLRLIEAVKTEKKSNLTKIINQSINQSGGKST